MSNEMNNDGGEERGENVNWRPRPCPICSRMSVPDYRPFCSKRCADLDLGRWLKGHYSFRGGPAPQNQDGG